MKRTIAVTGVFVFLSSLTFLAAQVPNQQLAMKIADARRQNSVTMKQYTWNCRTELIDQGKTADIRLELINYGPDGQLQRTVINDQGAQLPRGFLRRAVAENQKQQIEKYLKGLHGLLDQYALPSAGKILDFISSASINGVQGPGGTALLQMSGANVVVPGDSVTLAVDPATQQTRQLTISTSFEGSAVTISASFKTNGSGLTYMNFAHIEVPDKQIQLQVQNFDFEKQN